MPNVDMTLRDYFAAEALRGLVVRINPTEDEQLTVLAEACYNIADAMLSVRANSINKKPQR